MKVFLVWDRTAKRQTLAAVVIGFVIAALTGSFPALFIRNIGSLIRTLGGRFGLSSADAKKYAAIFDQLREASIQPPYWLLVICLIVAIVTVLFVFSRSPRPVVIGIIILLLLGLLSLWFTCVNDLQFGIVVGSLVKMLTAGAF